MATHTPFTLKVKGQGRVKIKFRVSVVGVDKHLHRLPYGLLCILIIIIIIIIIIIGYKKNNNNNNIQDNVYGAVIMAEPLGEFTRFI